MLRCGHRGAWFDGKEHDYLAHRTPRASQTLIWHGRILESHWNSLVRLRNHLQVVKVDYTALWAQGYAGEESRQMQGPCSEHGYWAGNHMQYSDYQQCPGRLDSSACTLTFQEPWCSCPLALLNVSSPVHSGEFESTHSDMLTTVHQCLVTADTFWWKACWWPLSWWAVMFTQTAVDA